MTTNESKITALTQRIGELEAQNRERKALTDTYMKRVEELASEMKEIDKRVHSIQRAVDVIQTRMAMVTAGAALAGAVIGEVLIRLVTRTL